MGGSLIALLAANSFAQSVPITHGTLELIAENQSIEPGDNSDLGLHFRLEKGWHIYWVNPGDSGEPPRMKWQLPAGLSAGEIEWPTPKRLGSSSVVDFGYEDEVLLLVPISVASTLAPQSSARLGAEARLLVCSHEMCVPGKADLSLTLPVKAQKPVADPKSADLFAATRKSLPRAAPSSWNFSVTDTADSFVLTAKVGRARGAGRVTQALFFPIVESQIANAAPQKFAAVDSGFRLALRKSDQLLKPIARLKGVLVVSAGGSQSEQSYLIDVAVTKPVAARNTVDHTNRDSEIQNSTNR